MSTQEQLEETEFKETKTPFLRVATGGKGPPDYPGGPVDNWLERLPVRTQFACRPNVNTVDWEMYFLVHKFTNIYFLKMETPDGKIWERRVDPKVFCKHYRDYEEIAHYPEVTDGDRNELTEAPEGDANGSAGERNPD